MSAISLKSITGITSITTPAGVDNQLTLHNNNTTEAVKLDIAGNLHFHNHLNITGVSTASNFKTGSTNVHSTGVELANINTGGGTATFGGGITVAGVIDANGDLDVDGHTNLDNVSIAGITTGGGFKTAGTSSDAGATNAFTAGRINIYDNNSHNIFRIGTHPSYAPTVFSTSNITFSTNGFYIRNTAATRNYIGINNSTGILQLGYGASSGYGYKLETSAKGIKVGTGVTIETNGQATFSGIVTATSFSGDGSSLSNLPAGAPVGGASTNTVFFENDTAVAVNYQVTSGKNAMSAGPIAINAGIAVTVPSGSSWTIV